MHKDLSFMTPEELDGLMERYYLSSETITSLITEFDLDVSVLKLYKLFPKVETNIKCPKCGTSYMWEPIPRSRFTIGPTKGELGLYCPNCKHRPGSSYCQCSSCREERDKKEREAWIKREKKKKARKEARERRLANKSNDTNSSESVADRLYASFDSIEKVDETKFNEDELKINNVISEKRSEKKEYLKLHNLDKVLLSTVFISFSIGNQLIVKSPNPRFDMSDIRSKTISKFLCKYIFEYLVDNNILIPISEASPKEIKSKHDKSNSTFDIFDMYYKINLEYYPSLAFDMKNQSFDYKYNDIDYLTEDIDKMYRFWTVIETEECLQYLASQIYIYRKEKIEFNSYIIDSIYCLLKSFTPSQVFCILWKAVKNSAYQLSNKSVNEALEIVRYNLQSQLEMYIHGKSNISNWARNTEKSLISEIFFDKLFNLQSDSIYENINKKNIAKLYIANVDKNDGLIFQK